MVVDRIASFTAQHSSSQLPPVPIGQRPLRNSAHDNVQLRPPHPLQVLSTSPPVSRASNAAQFYVTPPPLSQPPVAVNYASLHPEGLTF